MRHRHRSCLPALALALALIACAPAAPPNTAPPPTATPAPAAAAPTKAPTEDIAALRTRAGNAYNALDFSTCADLFRRVAEAEADADVRNDTLYSAACCDTLSGALDQGLNHLRRAAEGGFADAKALELDPELNALHARPGWQDMLRRVRENHDKLPHPPPDPPILMAVDVYGSHVVDPEAARRILGAPVGEPYVFSQALSHMKEAELLKTYPLAFAKVSFVQFHGGAEAGHTYLTIDLVDKDDAARARFLPEPSGHPPDPAGIVAMWREYETKARVLLSRGELDLTKAKCRIHHCAMGFDHPKLEAYEPTFVARAPENLDALAIVLRTDADPQNRAAAAFLLAYAREPPQSVERLLGSIRDPSFLVRNNVLRVLNALQEAADHPIVALDTVIDALSMPETTDRNKALYLLKNLLSKMPPTDRASRRKDLARRIGASLLELSAMRQPANRDPAVSVLELISDEKHTTKEEWRAWLDRQR